ncbi:MAG: sugar ABC transporter ATP-binding protein [Hyphomicrobiales bacterium]|nr:sugar ABC transporter ATP-binding protein [Hyphomicrobiales bacterium]
MILAARQIGKSFPGVRSLDRVDFAVEAGEVRALVGENGAGKSTLIKIIAGAYSADEGAIEFDGKRVKWSSPHEAKAAGIHVIYQELVLFPEMTVAQNIFANDQPRNRIGLTDRRAVMAGTRRILEDLGSALDPIARVKELSVADQQMVEIARALNSEARLLIFDEPTAVLGGPEVDLLFNLIRRLKQRGVAIIFISHRLDEIFDIADSATVLKDGQLVGTEPIGNLDHDKLVSMMIGRQLADIYPPKPTTPPAEEIVLAASDIWVGSRVKGVSLEVRKGEILGLAGMVGAGRTEVAHAVFGGLPMTKGSVRIGSAAISRPTPRQSIASGVGFLTEDRKGEGLFMLLDVAANISAPILDRVTRAFRIDGGAEDGLAEEQIRKYAIAAPGPQAPIANLSGGNQQKVLIGRWVGSGHMALILDEPTRGVDVGAKMEIYRIIRELAADGIAILIISSELPEIIGLCDRVIVMCEGRQTGELTGDAITEEAILQLAVSSGHASDAVARESA